MTICFLIRNLHIGGAERQLIELAKGLQASKHKVCVLVFRRGGSLESTLSAAGIPIFNIERNRNVFCFLYRLLREIRKISPDVIHSYLHLSNCLIGILKPFIGTTRIAWGIRSAKINERHYGWRSRLTYALARLLSNSPDLIILNSFAARDYSAKQGFPLKKMTVIHNGFDIDAFYPDIDERNQIRQEWNLSDNEVIVGLIGRIDYMKDHPTFLRAASLVSQLENNVKFICMGNGDPCYVDELQSYSDKLGLKNKVLWSDARKDMRKVYNGLDLLCSSSRGESFSNVIGEAMACGTPCVVTDVGDSKFLVENTGTVVPPSDPSALAEGILSTLSQLSPQKSILARDRISTMFSIKNLVQKTEESLLRLITHYD